MEPEKKSVVQKKYLNNRFFFVTIIVNKFYIGGDSMAGKNRLDLIRQIIINEKNVNVTALSEQFEVTEETIRRDLGKLAIEGVVKRTYGGAILNAEPGSEGQHFYKRMTVHSTEKKAIALKALSMLENKHTIAADSSTTVLETLRLLKNREDITVLTNSVEALHELLQSNMTIISTGGILNSSTMSLQGVITNQTIENYAFDVVLVSCKGLDKERGALDSNEAEAGTKLSMLKHAEKVIMLMDHTKFDRSAFLKLADLAHIDYLITDQKPSDNWLSILAQNKIEVIY